MVAQILGPDGRPMRSEYSGDGMALPHVVTFASIIGAAKAYYHQRWDEAWRHSREDALIMKRDAFLMGRLQERMKAVSSLKWHLNVPDEKDPLQAAVRDEMDRIIRGIPGLRRIIKALGWATWYGRYGTQLKWIWKQHKGRRELTVRKWTPVNGDKIGHLFDGTPYILVHGAHGELPGAEYTQTTYGSRGLLLKGGWRDRFLIHVHEIEDADFFESEMAERVHGVGVRDVIFFYNWIRLEWLGKLTDWIERAGLGVNLWYYEAGNQKSLEETKNAALNQSDRLNILVPRSVQGKGYGPGFERMEVPTSGAEVLIKLQEHLQDILREYINGQSLSSKSEGSGLGGSQVADLHSDTKYKLTADDAAGLGETLSGSDDEPGLVNTIQKWTFPETFPSDQNPDGFPVTFCFDLEKAESAEKLEAGTKLISAGVELKTDEIREVGGYSKPKPGDDTVGGQQPGMVGPDGQPMQPGQPSGPGQPPPGQPKPAKDESTPGARSGATDKPQLMQRADAPVYYGQWITIGAKESGDGGKNGGTPVYVENGRITKGHPSLTGRKIDSLSKSTGDEPEPKPDEGARSSAQPTPDKPADPPHPSWQQGLFGGPGAKSLAVQGKMFGDQKPLDEPKDHKDAPGQQMLPGTEQPQGQPSPAAKLTPEVIGTHRQQLNQGKEYQRAVWAKQARKAGLDPRHLHQLAGEIMEHGKAFAKDAGKMLKEARRMSVGMGYGDLRNVAARNASGKIDSNSLRGLDDIAERMSEEWPELFNGHDAQERLFDMLTTGVPQPIAEDDAYQQAMDVLQEHKAAEDEQDAKIKAGRDEPVPFQRGNPVMYVTDAVGHDHDEKGLFTGDGSSSSNSSKPVKIGKKQLESALDDSEERHELMLKMSPSQRKQFVQQLAAKWAEKAEAEFAEQSEESWEEEASDLIPESDADLVKANKELEKSGNPWRWKRAMPDPPPAPDDWESENPEPEEPTEWTGEPTLEDSKAEVDWIVADMLKGQAAGAPIANRIEQLTALAGKKVEGETIGDLAKRAAQASFENDHADWEDQRKAGGSEARKKAWEKEHAAWQKQYDAIQKASDEWEAEHLEKWSEADSPFEKVRASKD